MTILADKLIAARIAKGWSQDDLAEHARVSQQTIGKLETGAARSSKFLVRIANALEVPPGQIDDEFGSIQAQPQSTGYRAPPELLGARDFPIYAAVEGGPGAMVVTNDVIEMVQRPWYMRDVAGYGVLVVGESMDPAFKPGDIAIVNPKLPPIRGKNAIFVAGEDHGEFRASIKEYVKQDAKLWHVLQHNPPDGSEKEFSLEKKDWSKALRVVGKYEGG